MTLTQNALTYDNDYLDEDNNPAELLDERRQPLVGRLPGQRAVRRSRRLRRMPAGWAGTPQAVKRPRQCGSRGKSADSAAKRRMSAVLPDWSEMDRSVTRSRVATAS